MQQSQIFQVASRIKARFETPKGLLTVEQLWDLPLTSTDKANLDEIAMDLDRRIKSTAESSFVVKERKVDMELQVKFEVVKSVIETRMAEREAAEKARANSEKKRQLLSLIAQKENEQLAGTSLEDLRKMVDSL